MWITLYEKQPRAPFLHTHILKLQLARPASLPRPHRAHRAPRQPRRRSCRHKRRRRAHVHRAGPAACLLVPGGRAMRARREAAAAAQWRRGGRGLERERQRLEGGRLLTYHPAKAPDEWRRWRRRRRRSRCVVGSSRRGRRECGDAAEVVPANVLPAAKHLWSECGAAAEVEVLGAAKHLVHAARVLGREAARDLERGADGGREDVVVVGAVVQQAGGAASSAISGGGGGGGCRRSGCCRRCCCRPGGASRQETAPQQR